MNIYRPVVFHLYNSINFFYFQNPPNLKKSYGLFLGKIVPLSLKMLSQVQIQHTVVCTHDNKTKNVNYIFFMTWWRYVY
jgi:hypothetical protein